MNYSTVIDLLKSQADENNVRGMARFGISTTNTLGISVNYLRNLAKSIGKNHQLALDLWNSGIHEARILATIIAEAKLSTEEQLDQWVNALNSWDICDQFCGNLVVFTPFAFAKIYQWAEREEEFVRRAAFSTIAYSATKKSKKKDEDLLQFLPLIKDKATDERNFVKKAVNWALRQIGKRSKSLCLEAIKTAEEILEIDSKSARWIASDALRELNSKILLFD